MTRMGHSTSGAELHINWRGAGDVGPIVRRLVAARWVLAVVGGTALAVLALSSPAMGAVRVNPDRSVTFTLTAPNADAVEVMGEGGPFFGTVPMTKDATGVWTVTVGPLNPNWYAYRYDVDGLRIPDPANRDVYVGLAEVAPESTSQWSFVFVPGPEVEYMADRDVPHGAVTTERYRSGVTNTQRRVTIYTPPGYGRSHRIYPTLYLQHGGGDNETSWIIKGRAHFILDNLIAERKIRPMVVVMPSGNLGQFGPGPAQDLFPTELVDHIVPVLEDRYRVDRSARGRAFAGLSLGGLQAMSVLLARTGEFRYVGIFSSGRPRSSPAPCHPDPVIVATIARIHPGTHAAKGVNFQPTLTRADPSTVRRADPGLRACQRSRVLGDHQPQPTQRGWEQSSLLSVLRNARSSQLNVDVDCLGAARRPRAEHQDLDVLGCVGSGEQCQLAQDVGEQQIGESEGQSGRSCAQAADPDLEVGCRRKR